MTSDINGTVIALQGNAVQAGTLNSVDDGYVLTWNNVNNQWEAKAPVGLKSQTFTSSGTWVCPANVFNVWITGWGGGGGGGGGCGNTIDAFGGGGGGAAVKTISVTTVIPGASYNVIIGGGGNGATGIISTGAQSRGTVGSPTTFGSILTALGGGGGSGDSNTHAGANFTFGGLNSPNVPSFYNYSALNDWESQHNIGSGGVGSNCGNHATDGMPQEAYVGGTKGTNQTYGGAGGGGGAGPDGNGANGGQPGNGAVGGNGSNAAANSGAGGGGGGGTTSNNSGGNGGNGGSGQLTIAWVG